MVGIKYVESGQTILGGAVLAAAIGGAFSFLSLVVAKEQKISEFRQAWIDGLRQDIANFVAAAYHMAVRVLDEAEMSREELIKFRADIQETQETLARCNASIRLRVNPSEPDPAHRAANELLLENIKDVWDQLNARNSDKIFAAGSALVDRI
jgi:hypothetical protein